jgi:hypothetical protein
MTDKLEIAESTLFQAREKVLCDEIKSLRQQLSSYVKEDEIKANVNKLLVEQLAESQAREKVLRDALDVLARLGNEPIFGNSRGNCIAINALATPSDSTALDAMVKQAKREALNHVIRVWEINPDTSMISIARRMAEELK